MSSSGSCTGNTGERDSFFLRSLFCVRRDDDDDLGESLVTGWSGLLALSFTIRTEDVSSMRSRREIGRRMLWERQRQTVTIVG